LTSKRITGYRISPQQRRVWSLQEADGSPYYRVQFAALLTGSLDNGALAEALRRVARRQEILRAHFVRAPGMDSPLQVITDDAAPPLIEHDLSDQGEAQQQESVRSAFARALGQSFAFEQPPLLRTELFKLASERSLLLVSAPAICADTATMENFIRELSEAYAAGGVRQTQEPAGDYISAAEWSNELLQSEEAEVGREYWRRQQSGESGRSALPFERTARETGWFAPQSLAAEIPEAVAHSINDYAAGHEAPVEVFLLACLQVLLWRLTGEVTVGVSFSGRMDEELEALPGPLEKYLPLSGGLQSDMPFNSLLPRVAGDMREHSKWQECFSRDDESLRGEAGYFSICFDYREPPTGYNAAGLSWSVFKRYACVERFKLRLSCHKHGARLMTELYYDPRRIPFADARLFLDYYLALLERASANPGLAIAALDLLTGAERRRLLEGFNDTAVEFPEHHCIHHLVEEQVRRTPDAVAVVFKDRSLTYSQLDERANLLARFLQMNGVGPDVRVGVCMERSIEMVVAILGTLKAGGAYAPLDPAYPQERLDFMLEDSAASLLLTQSHLRVPAPDNGRLTICLDTQWELIAAGGELASPAPAVADHIAYVIYTSGSTGRPKGVMVPHRALVNHMQWMQAAFPLGRADSVLQRTPFSFDASVWEFYTPLLAGARLIMAGPGDHQDSAYLVRLIREENVSFIQMVPSLLRLFLQEPGLEACASLRVIFSGGEPLPADLAERLFTRLSCALCNLYGPTETCVDTTYWLCPPADDRRAVPIGRPISNTRVYLLDERLQPAPVYAAGELYIGGVNLARGYLQRPEQTAERFAPDHLSGGGERLYRTGDVARRLAGGEIEFLGRVDHQVKLRGFRIEMAEIEAALHEHKDVRQAAVIVREDQPGDQRLTAYLVARGSRAPGAAEIRARLKERLPDYMVPLTFVFLDHLPLLPNGKIDRNALPRPAESHRESMSVYEAPRTQAERILAEIWAGLLAVERVGVHDNFFEIGGDSILGLQSVARANQAGLRLTPRQLFEHQTVAQLVKVAGQGEAATFEQGLVTGDVPLTPIQEWFFEQDFSDPDHFNQAIIFSVTEALDPEALRKAVGKLLAHHDALRGRYWREGGGWRQRIGGAAEPAYVAEDVAEDVAQVVKVVEAPASAFGEAVTAASAEAQRSLDLGRGELMRVVVIDGGEERRLAVVAHHLAIDGVSWRVLLEDLESGYRQAAAGKEIELPAKTTSFKHWAEALHRYARSQEAMNELEFWTGELGVDLSCLPLDYEKGENRVGSGRTLLASLDERETRQLLTDVLKTQNARIDEILIAALGAALSQYVDGEFILIEREGHGREEIMEGVDLSRTVGWFTSLTPVVLALHPENGVTGRIECAKERLRRVPKGGVGYGLLKYLCSVHGVRERMNALPKPEISFNYLGQLDQVLTGESLLRPAAESAGPNRSLRGNRSYLLDVNALVAGGRLQVEWTYGAELHERGSIETLAADYLNALREIIDAAARGRRRRYSPSDFPLVKLKREDLDRIIAEARSLEDIYPLSSLQEGMLFHLQYQPDSVAFFVQVSYEIRGPLNVEALKRAWGQVVDRYDALRASFHWRDFEEPVQVIHSHVECPFQEHDWTLAPAESLQHKLESYLQADQERGFDLSQAPLMRSALIKTAEEAHHLVWSSHHLVMDGWSSAIVLREVISLYRAYERNQEPQPTACRPYRDYIKWLGERDLAQAEAYWRNRLKGFTTPNRLKIGQPGPPAQRFQELAVELSEELTASLQKLARNSQVTLNTLIQGGWALLLSGYCGEEDIVYGAVVSGRPAELAGVEDMVGLFINTLPVRVNAGADEELRGWLKGLQAQFAEMIQYEYSPLAQTQGWSEAPASAPLFETIVTFENYPVDDSLRAQPGEIEIPYVRSIERNNYPLALLVVPNQRLMLQIIYDCGRFDSHTAAQILHHFEILLKGMADHPDWRLLELSLLIENQECQPLSHAVAQGSYKDDQFSF